MGGASRERWNSAAKLANAVRTLVAPESFRIFSAGFVLYPHTSGLLPESRRRVSVFHPPPTVLTKRCEKDTTVKAKGHE